MEELPGGILMQTGPFPLSTDAMVLADFIRLPTGAKVLDIGSGCGTLGLLLCGTGDCAVTGVELDPAAHRLAEENIRRNGLAPRLGSICADMNAIPTLFPAGFFHACVANPPYFTGGAPHAQAPLARQEGSYTLPALMSAAAWALRYGGSLFLVHRPERLAEIFALAAARGLEPKRLRLVRHRIGGPVSLVLVQCKKGAGPGLKWEEIALWDAAGGQTADYQRIYHTGGAL